MGYAFSRWRRDGWFDGGPVTVVFWNGVGEGGRGCQDAVAIIMDEVGVVQQLRVVDTVVRGHTPSTVKFRPKVIN